MRVYLPSPPQKKIQVPNKKSPTKKNGTTNQKKHKTIKPNNNQPTHASDWTAVFPLFIFSPNKKTTPNDRGLVQCPDGRPLPIAVFGHGLAADGAVQHLSLHGTDLQRHETGDSIGRYGGGTRKKLPPWWLVVFGYDEYYEYYHGDEW